MLKPTTTLAARMGRLEALRDMGYQVGSGIILGLPGQDRMSVARDLILCGEEDYEMVSVGPFVAHPDTPLGQRVRGQGQGESQGWPSDLGRAHGQTQAYATALPNARAPVQSTLNTMAVARLLTPMAHIPAATALGVVGRHDGGWRGQAARYLDTMGAICGDSEYSGDARYIALLAGANVFMLDVTPWTYRGLYEIYPGKPGADGDELADSVDSAIREIRGLGMSVCPGRGDSPKAPWSAARDIRREDTQKGECSDDARPS